MRKSSSVSRISFSFAAFAASSAATSPTSASLLTVRCHSGELITAAEAARTRSTRTSSTPASRAPDGPPEPGFGYREDPRTRALRSRPERDQRASDGDETAEPDPSDQWRDDHAESGRRRIESVALRDHVKQQALRPRVRQWEAPVDAVHHRSE